MICLWVTDVEDFLRELRHCLSMIHKSCLIIWASEAKHRETSLSYLCFFLYLIDWMGEREKIFFMINWKLYVKVYILFHSTICSARLTYTNVDTNGNNITEIADNLRTTTSSSSFLSLEIIVRLELEWVNFSLHLKLLR